MGKSVCKRGVKTNRFQRVLNCTPKFLNEGNSITECFHLKVQKKPGANSNEQKRDGPLKLATLGQCLLSHNCFHHGYHSSLCLFWYDSNGVAANRQKHPNPKKNRVDK